MSITDIASDGDEVEEPTTGSGDDDIFVPTNNPNLDGWRSDANCLGVDPDLFFPERGASTKEAKSVCKGCAVSEYCLEYALANGEKFGIWGGMSERERRRIRRQRNLNRAKGVVVIPFPQRRVVTNAPKLPVPPPSRKPTVESVEPAATTSSLRFRQEVLLKYLSVEAPHSWVEVPASKGDTGLAEQLRMALDDLLPALLPLVEASIVERITYDGVTAYVVTPLAREEFDLGTRNPKRPAVQAAEQEVVTPDRAPQATTPAPQPREEPTKGVELTMRVIDERSDLTDLDKKILVALIKHQEYTDESGRATSQLVSDIGAKAPDVSTRLKRLEEKGLIDRDINGKRTYSIGLTDDGIALFNDSSSAGASVATAQSLGEPLDLSAIGEVTEEMLNEASSAMDIAGGDLEGLLEEIRSRRQESHAATEAFVDLLQRRILELSEALMQMSDRLSESEQARDALGARIEELEGRPDITAERLAELEALEGRAEISEEDLQTLHDRVAELEADLEKKKEAIRVLSA